MKPTAVFALIIGLCTTSCSQQDSSEKGGTSAGPTIELYPTAAQETQFLEKLGVVAMNKLNDCVAKQVTTLVNNVQGNVDTRSTSNIAAKAVMLCDDLVNDAVNEQVSTLKASVADPIEFKQKAAIREQLETRSFDDWRKIHVNGKIAFAKMYVNTVADRFKSQPQQQDKSGSVIAPNN